MGEARETSEAWALRDSQELLKAVLEASPDVILLASTSGTIRYVNHVLPGFDLDRVVGSSIYEFVPADQASIMRECIARVLATGEPGGYQIRGPGALGVDTEWETRVVPLRRGGAIEAVYLVCRDVGELRRMEGQLLLADRMATMGRMAVGVGHEINNPLTFVMTSLEALDARLAAGAAPEDGAAELRRLVANARDGAERVRRIVRDLATFARPATDATGPVDVHRVIEASLALAWNELRHRARLVRDYGEDLPPAEATETQLGQIVLNLVVNAAQAIPEGDAAKHEVRVTTRAREGRVIIAVSDTGRGIAPDTLGRIFDPFFTTKAPGAGTGLGLSISRRLVERLGGQITVESRVGTGSLFRVTLPAARDAHAAVAPAPPEPTAPAPAHLRILVVDDEEAIGKAVTSLLTPEHEVASMTSGAQALSSIAAGARFDAILCDLMMPDLPGPALYERIRAIDPAQAARMIFVSGGAFTPQAQEFLRRVPNSRIEKPFGLEDLSRVLHMMAPA